MSLGYSEFFVPGQARDTRAISSVVDRNVALVVSGSREPVPSPVLVRVTQGVPGVLNVAGATSINEQADRQKLFDLVVRLFGGDPSLPFRLNPIAIGSGGTRVLDSESTRGSLTGTMTAVETPGLAYTIAMRNYPGAENQAMWPRTWGHAPRTAETLGYGGEHSSIALAETLDASAIPNPILHLLWLVQKNASERAKWDGDLKNYTNLLADYQGSGEGESGQLILSGGGVTAKEILFSLQRELPVLCPLGLGRASDDVVLLKEGRLDQIKEEKIRGYFSEIREQGLDLRLITTFDADHPEEGQNWLQDMGFGVRL